VLPLFCSCHGLFFGSKLIDLSYVRTQARGYDLRAQDIRRILRTRLAESIDRNKRRVVALTSPAMNEDDLNESVYDAATLLVHT